MTTDTTQALRERQALEAMIRRAVESEGVPLPDVWKSSVTELCVRVITKFALGQPATTPAQPVAIVSGVAGAGPNDVCIEWRGGIVSVGTKLYTTAPAASGSLNLNCKSEQKRLATLWGFAPAASGARDAVPEGWRHFLESLVDIWEDGKKEYDDRSYVGGSFASVMEELTKLLTEEAARASADEKGQA